MALRARIIVKGVVQGVGFRPYVYTLADSLELKGYVTNTADGVLIDIEGARLSEFVRLLPKEPPPLSQITDVSVTSLPLHGYREFTIQQSVNQDTEGLFTLVSPDVSVCDDCLNEMLDPSDRRYLYPFINCTNCGPRYSITKSVPYDRPNTTMASFTMCPECEKEYHDPKNRRFHAQPNACSTCGPEVEFVGAAPRGCPVQSSDISPSPNPSREGRGISITPSPLTGERKKTTHLLPWGERTEVRGKALKACIQLLLDGGIIAIKGLGGFHIACDATNDDTVRKLRERKRKSNKPFAVMAPDVDTVRQFCEVTEEEKALLESSRRPIVLLRKKNNKMLSEAISPNNQYIGVMLPYTPLHYLLFHDSIQKRSLADSALRMEPVPLAGQFAFHALVMTSGNLSEEPIVHENDDAIKKLYRIVDAFLVHNRDIFMRVDDSVVRVTKQDYTPSPNPLPNGERTYTIPPLPSGERAGVRGNSELPASGTGRTPNSELSFVRRARGYAPEAIPLHDDGPEVLGCGADLKNTFTLTKGAYAIPSQHIGDMENYETLKFYEETLENLKSVYRVNPIAIVHDLHPGYMTTKWAIDCGLRIADCGLKTPNSELMRFPIQHHYAHIGSVMAEHGLKGKVIGVAFDGTGFGTDGNLWGGEFLIAGIDGFERVGQFKYVSLPGGEAAIREPWRTAVSYIADAAGEKTVEYLRQTGFMERYGREVIKQVMTVAQSRELSPLSSGAGRLFDAVSALLGICDVNTFEGEAAMALESYTQEGIEDEYAVEFRENNGYTVIDFAPAIREIVHDVVDGRDKKLVSTCFHNTVASVIRYIVRDMSERRGIIDVALSGGTFQNLYLLKKTVGLLEDGGLNVYVNQKAPCNDAGISLGQAYIIRERLRKQ